MRKLPKRKGISLGTVTMLMVTSIVVLFCGWLFPRLLGNMDDVHFDAGDLAVAFDRSYRDITAGLSAVSTTAEPPPSHQVTWQTAPSQPSGSATSVAASTTALPTPAPTKASFQLTIGGSVQVDSAVQKAMSDKSGDRFADILAPISEETVGDFTLLTLENTIVSTEKVSNINAPAAMLSALRSNGFFAVCLGHANVLNSGIAGLSATQEALRAAEMLPYGAYASQQQRDAIAIEAVKGIPVALLSYQSELSSAGKKKASKDEQSFALVPPDLPVITSDILAAKSAGAQIVVVSLSWGKKGATAPTQAQRELAQAVADAGADVIIGTGSGALQPVEVLTANRGNGRKSQTLCAYSMGNLFSNDRNKRISISGILLHARLTYDAATAAVTFDQLSYTPTYVWRGKKDGKNAYAVLPSDRPAPEYVDKEQRNVMERSLALVQEVMIPTPVAQRSPGNIFFAE